MSRVSILPDTRLSGYSTDVERSLSTCAASLSIEDLQSLMDRAACAAFDSAMIQTGAESGTIWLADKDRTKLTIGYSHTNKDLVGHDQALNEGLVSLVLASENGICENSVYQNEKHSKRVDQTFKFITCAMIAVPFYLGGNLSGVISFVRLKPDLSAPDPAPFSAGHLANVQQLSTTIERLLNYRLLRILLDLQV